MRSLFYRISTFAFFFIFALFVGYLIFWQGAASKQQLSILGLLGLLLFVAALPVLWKARAFGARKPLNSQTRVQKQVGKRPLSPINDIPIRPRPITRANQRPVFVSPALFLTNRGDNVGQSVSLAIIATDPDGDTITYGASNLPPGLSINPATGLIRGTISNWIPNESPYDVTIWASDGFLSETRIIRWTVIPVQLPPPQMIGVVTTVQNQSSYPLLTLEIDGQNQLNADLQPGDSVSVSLSPGTYTIHAAAYSDASTNIYGQTITIYIWDFQFQAGHSISFTDPSINDVLADYGSSAIWIGYYTDANFQQILLQFNFFSNGTFEVLDNNVFLARGTFRQVSTPNTFDISRQFQIIPTGNQLGNNGYLYESLLSFNMDIGPNNSIVEFQLQP